MSTQIKLKFSDMFSAVIDVLEGGLVPIVRGRPGAGKSALGKLVANHYDLKMIDVRLAQIDPVELNGFPDLAGAKAVYKPMDIFPVEGDRLPVKEGHQEDYNKVIKQAIKEFGSLEAITEEVWNKIEAKHCYKGWLLFFDEITNANRTTQGAAYKIILDGEVGQLKLHHKVMKMAAGNNTEDKAAANEMTTAMQSRLVHLHMGQDLEGFTTFMIEQGWVPQIPAFLAWKPNLLNSFDPDHQDYTYSCERTWEMANNVIQGAWKGQIPAGKKAVLAGTLSMPVANEFMAFCRIWQDLPSFEEVMKRPEDIAIPEEPGSQFAIAGMMGANITKDNADTAMKFVSRLPQSMALLCIHMAFRRDKGIVASKSILDFIRKHRENWLQ